MAKGLDVVFKDNMDRYQKVKTYNDYIRSIR